MAPEIKGKPQVHTPQPTGVSSSTPVPQPTTKPANGPAAPPPDVPVPSANGNTGVVLGANIDKKRDAELRKTLDTLTAEIGGGSDAQAIKKALDKAKNAANRDDVKAALSALSEELDNHADFGAIVFKHVKTDHFDYAKATLKAVAKEIGVKLGGSQGVSRLFSEVKAQVDGRLSDYAQELEAFDPANDVPKILAMPEAQALETLLHFGATDLEEAQEWLAKLRAGVDLNAMLKHEANDRKMEVHRVSADFAGDMSGLGGTRGLAVLLLRYPSFAPDILPELGDKRGEVEAAIKHQSEEDALRYADWVRNGVVSVVGLTPWAAIAVGGNGLYELATAYSAARSARVCAAAGLVSREHAERLDDEVVSVGAMAVFSTAVSLIPAGNKLIGEAVRHGGIAAAVKAIGKLAAEHPKAFATLMGSFGAATQTEFHDALKKDDYAEAGWILTKGAIAGLITSTSIEAVKKYGPKFLGGLEKMLRPGPRAPSTPTPVPTTPKPTPTPAATAKSKPVSGVVAEGGHGGKYDPKYSKAPPNPTLKLPPKK